MFEAVEFEPTYLDSTIPTMMTWFNLALVAAIVITIVLLRRHLKKRR